MVHIKQAEEAEEHGEGAAALEAIGATVAFRRKKGAGGWVTTAHQRTSAPSDDVERVRFGALR